MTKFTRRTGVLVALLAAGAMSACGDDDDGGNGDGGAGADASATIKFMQPLPKSIAFYPHFVAEELGYFEDENVDVELLEGDGGAAVALQVAGGNVDIASAPSPDVLGGLSEGQDWKVVYDDMPGNVFSIVVPEDGDVQTVEDLEGKNLGITSQSGGEVGIVTAALNDAELEQDTDVKITVVGSGGPQVAKALESGTIDAYAAAINDIPALEAAGLSLRDITPEQYAKLPSSPFFLPADALADEELRPVVVRFLRAWSKAAYVGIVNQDAVFEMAKEAVPEEAADEDFARPFLEISVDLRKPPGDILGEPAPDAWSGIQELLVAGEVIPEVIPPEQFLDEALLEEVNDWDRAEVEADAKEWAGQGS